MKIQKVSQTNKKKTNKDGIVLPDDIFSEGLFHFVILILMPQVAVK